eukprot:13584092-Alexandrium_andersonii.AAC.1
MCIRDSPRGAEVDVHSRTHDACLFECGQLCFPACSFNEFVKRTNVIRLRPLEVLASSKAGLEGQRCPSSSRTVAHFAGVARRIHAGRAQAHSHI